MDRASIFLLNLAFPLFFELSLCQTDCNGCCDPRYYSVINEPRRSINSVWKRGHTAICDRTLSWGWYRFTSYVGGQMPTSRVNPYHCGTVAPIWLSGQHPSSADRTVTVKACINFYNISDGCSQSFNLKIRQCSAGSPPFYVYYLRPTYSCAVAYCAGTTKPCDYGQVYSNNQCVAAPAEFNRDFLGEPKITPYPPDPKTAEVALKCEVPVNDFIRSWKNVTYQITWYSEGKRLNTAFSICERLPAPLLGNSTIIPDYDKPCLKKGRPLFSRLEGTEYNLHRWISCNVTARHFRSPLSPWCIPKTVRKPFFAGIKVSPSVLTVEDCSPKEYRFSLTPTIPVARSPHTGSFLNISFYLPPNIQMQQCIVELRDKKNVSVRVIARCTNSKKPASKIDKVIVPEIRGTHSMFWNRDMHLPGVWLSVKAANEIHYCRSSTDPHYQPLPVRLSSGSWDPRPSFTFMGLGDFILYKNTERNFEVHTRQWECVDDQNLVTCNCGLVLRDHNDVIEFNCCNKRRYFDKMTPMRVKVRSKQRLAPGISITQTQISFYAAYKVLFPSGVKVDVFRNTFGLNIDLYTPRAKQRANESGLCLYDKQVEPDINQYGYRFRLNHWESFFDVLPSPINDTGVRYDIPCSCDKKDANGNPECKKELPTHYPNILDKQGRPVDLSGSHGLGRKKRNVEDSDDLTDEDFDLFQRLNFGYGVHNRVRRAAPAVSRFSKENATHYCRKLIADTNISKSCAKVGSNVQALVNSCSIDLELSGDTSFALSAVTLLMNECGEIIGRNMSSYVNESSEEKPEIPPEISEIVENLCSSDCTFNGRCVNRTCICNHGFTANDCSISIYQIPDISMLQGDGLCDKRKRPCKKVSVMGSGFLNSTKMTCHVKEFTVTNSSWTPKQTEIRTTGVMTDLVLAECHLPESPVRPGYYHEVTSGTPAAGLVISMSNDGEHKSTRSLTFISYDSACMTCNVTTGCVLKKNSCFINNYCFATNEANPINWCQQCLPNMSERTWTKRQVNLPPQFLSTNECFALSQEDLELEIDVSDPEGMPVNLTLTDGSPTKAVMRDNILLWNATNDAKTSFYLKATDACGAVSTLNITVNLVVCQCQNGSCVPHRNKPRGSGFYECNCFPGFTGAKCETNMDDCQSYPCFQGYCIDEVNQFKCICNHGYVGKKCEIDYDDCAVSPCAHGNCTDYPGTYRCACDSGYGGENCSIDIDECQSSPCRHGTCVNKVNGFNCVCDAGFNGTRCENNINECLLNSCGNGICVDKVNSYSCICNSGFTGRQCNIAITHCSNDSCYPGVPCTEQISHIICGPCPSGFTGDGKICKELPTKSSESTREPAQLTTDEVSEERKIDFTFEVRVNEEWDDQLKDKNSEKYKKISTVLKEQIKRAYSGKSELQNVEIISLRKGTIVAEFKLTFKTSLTAKEAMAPLKQETADGKLGSLEVDSNSLKLKDNNHGGNKEEGSSKSSNLPLIIGITCGAIVLITTIVISVVFHCRRSNPRDNNSDGTPAEGSGSKRERYELKPTDSKDKDIVLVEEKGTSNEGME